MKTNVRLRIRRRQRLAALALLVVAGLTAEAWFVTREWTDWHRQVNQMQMGHYSAWNTPQPGTF